MLLTVVGPMLTFLLFIAGVVVMLEEEWALRKKPWFWVAFGMLGTATLIVSVLQGIEAYNADKSLDEAIRDLSESSLLNSELQREALALSRENRALSGDVLQRVIGDPENPPYLAVDNARVTEGHFQVRLYLVNSSPVYSARDVVVTLEAGGTIITGESQSIPPASRASVSVPNTVGLDARYVNVPSLAEVGAMAIFSLDVTCYAGRYSQSVGLFRSGELEILQAVRVIENGGSEVIFARADQGFPNDFAWPQEFEMN